MDADEVYAVAALFSSIAGATGFVIFRFSYLNLEGLLILGTGAFLTLVFVFASAYEALGRPVPSRSKSDSVSDTGDSTILRGRLPDIDFRSVVRSSSYSIAAFALAGFGIGLTGAVAILEFGGAPGTILGGLLLVVVFASAFIIGPVVGLATGIGIADGVLDGFLGATAGFIIMIAIVMVILVAATSTAAVTDLADPPDQPEPSEFDDPGPSPTPEPADSEIPWLSIFRTILTFSIPTGLVAGGAAALESRLK